MVKILNHRSIEKIIEDFKEHNLSSILGAIDSGDMKGSEIAQCEKDLQDLVLFAESRLKNRIS